MKIKLRIVCYSLKFNFQWNKIFYKLMVITKNWVNNNVIALFLYYLQNTFSLFKASKYKHIYNVLFNIGPVWNKYKHTVT